MARLLLWAQTPPQNCTVAAVGKGTTPNSTVAAPGTGATPKCTPAVSAGDYAHRLPPQSPPTGTQSSPALALVLNTPIAVLLLHAVPSAASRRRATLLFHGSPTTDAPLPTLQAWAAPTMAPC